MSTETSRAVTKSTDKILELLMGREVSEQDRFGISSVYELRDMVAALTGALVAIDAHRAAGIERLLKERGE